MHNLEYEFGFGGTPVRIIHCATGAQGKWSIVSTSATCHPFTHLVGGNSGVEHDSMN
jgi:hypothetical protein